MRLIATLLLIATLGASALAFNYRQDNNNLQQQVNDLTTQRERLLEELEQNTRQRLANQDRVNELTEQSTSAQARIRALSQQLEEVRERIDPNLEQLEQRIRARLDDEYQQRLATVTAELMAQPATVSSVIAQLGSLNTEQRMALISVQGQYGSFLDSLDVDAERKERVTEALLELNLSQAQAREDLISQGLEPQELAQQLLTLMSPQATRDILAYDLTDDELAAFDTFMEQRQSTFMAGAVGSGGVFMIRGDGANRASIMQQNGDIVINPDSVPGQAQRLIIQGATPADPDL